MRIIWSDESIEDMEMIFKYYLEEANRKVALKIINEIIDTVYRLKKFPQSGQKELLFHNRIPDYRYVVSGNHKSIYYIKGQDINIVSIFDCRQNPTKMELI